LKNKLPNIILIVMDTVGAKHMSLYGYPRRTTPNLERIAADCTVYTRCYAPSCWTMPSHASMFTGLYPSQHGCFEGKLMLHENVWHLATVLKMLGYRTLGISSNDLISEESGLSRDFDYFKNFGNGFYGFLNYLQSGFIADEANELAAHLEDSKTTREKLRKFFNYVYKNGNVGEGLERAENIIKNKIA
jgi:arylsulfatase A-like enzyme